MTYLIQGVLGALFLAVLLVVAAPADANVQAKQVDHISGQFAIGALLRSVQSPDPTRGILLAEDDDDGDLSPLEPDNDDDDNDDGDEDDDG